MSKSQKDGQETNAGIPVMGGRSLLDDLDDQGIEEFEVTVEVDLDGGPDQYRIITINPKPGR